MRTLQSSAGGWRGSCAGDPWRGWVATGPGMSPWWRIPVARTTEEVCLRPARMISG